MPLSNPAITQSIKSVQSGQSFFEGATGVNTLDITISAVDTTKTILEFLGVELASSSWQALPIMSLVNSTTIRFTRITDQASTTPSWRVVEYT